MISTRVGAPCLDRVGLFSEQWSKWFRAAQCMISTRVGAPCLDRVGLFAEQWFQSSGSKQLSA